MSFFRSGQQNGSACVRVVYASFGAGFTLIEVVVSIGILLMIGTGIITFERSVITNTKVLQAELNSQQQVRRTLLGYVTDLRSANRSSTGANAIEAAATSTLTFYANIDSDAGVERIRYFISTSSLRRGITKYNGVGYDFATEKVSTLVNDIANPTSTPIFTYFDTGYDGFTSSSSDPLPIPINIPLIRMIKMSIVVNPNGVRAPVMQTYTTQVSIRNLKDNL